MHAPVWRRAWLLLNYADTDLLELFFAGLVLVFAALSFAVHLTTDYPPATTGYGRFTSSWAFPWLCLTIGVFKIIAVLQRGLALRLAASLPLSGLFTMLTVLVANLSLRGLGWIFFAYLAQQQAAITARLALDLGRAHLRDRADGVAE